MRRSSRLQTRAAYARTPFNNLRVNSPDGFLHDFVPVGWGDYAAALEPGAWWVGSDTPGAGLTAVGPSGPFYGPSRTTGSPLTVPNRSYGAGSGAPVGVLPAVTRCTSVIVNPVIRTEWLVERAGVRTDTPLWISDPMGADSITGPTGPVMPAGRRLTAQPFWATVLTHAVWFGWGPFAFIENTDGQPVPGSLRVLNPYMVGVTDSGRFELLGDGDQVVSTDHDGRFDAGGVTWRIMAVRGMPPNNTHTPEGVLTRHFDVLRLGATIHTYSSNTFASGVPSGYLKVTSPNMTQPEADALKSSWMKAHGGDRRAVAVLNAVTDYVPVSISPVDADTHQLKAGMLADVALAFSLDPIWVGQGASGLNYSNSSERRADLVDLTVSARAQDLMETITAVLPLGTVCRVNWPSFTAPDVTVQGPVIVSLVQAGVVSVVEGRRMLGLPDPEVIPQTEGTING